LQLRNFPSQIFNRALARGGILTFTASAERAVLDQETIWRADGREVPLKQARQTSVVRAKSPLFFSGVCECP
jgi:hypothetical protein